MQENDKPVLIYATFPSVDLAEKTGNGLVERRLVACVNIIPGMISIYNWKGARQRDAETVMIIKTRTLLADAVIREVRALHPYENPALLMLPVSGGSQAFLDWIMSETRGDPSAS